MANRVVWPDAGGYYEVDGMRMPLPSIGAEWCNPNTGKSYKAVIGEDDGFWIEKVTPTTEQKTMSAIERFTNLDSILADARREAQLELDAASARIFQLETENTLLREQNRDARAAEKTAERLTVKLLTQFALVEKIFADVKAQAIELQQQETEQQRTAEKATGTGENPPQGSIEYEGYTDDPPHGEQPPPVPSRGTRKLREG